MKKELEVWVALAYKKVEKYKQGGRDPIAKYDSVQECVNNNPDATYYQIWHSSKTGTTYDGIYYKIIDNPPGKIEMVCTNCGKVFECQSFRTRRMKNVYCCKKCEFEYKRKNSIKNCVCPVCGKAFHNKPSQKKKCNNNYCSKKCFNISKIEQMSGKKNHQYGIKGSANASWKSDERISFYGYRLVRKLDHPFKNTDGFVFEHRLVAETYLLNDENSVLIDGTKYLSKDFIVHHINFDRQDNSKENLLVMKKGDHERLHQKLKRPEQLDAYCAEYNISISEVKNNIDKYKIKNMHD